MVTENTLRLFFALPCPPGQAAAICAWRNEQGLGGRPVPAANLHVTLAFLGARPAADLEAIRQVAAGIDCPSFDLVVNRLISLDQGFICLAPAEAPPALMKLADSLAERLRGLGLQLDNRPYLPHLTLTRHADTQTQGAAATFSWKAEHFVLYQSLNTPEGVRYRELDSWPLQSTAQP